MRWVVSARTNLARLVRPGSLVVLLVVTAAAIGGGLSQAAVPNEGYWKRGHPAEIGLVVLAALASAGYVLVILGYRRMLSVSDKGQRLYGACRDIAALVAHEADLDPADVAVHVWAVRGFPGVRRLERRATFVPHDRPPSPITWRKGKGVLGQVWAQDRWILADLESLAAAASEEQFYAIPREERFFFTWPEAQATSQYRAILAWPLHGGPENARRVIGCLSIDVQAPGGVAKLGKAWDERRQLLDAHRAVCEGVLSGA